MSTIPGAFLPNPKWWPNYLALHGMSFATQAGTAGRVFLTRLWLPRSMVISRITCTTTTSGGAGTFLRLGLYKDNGETPNGAVLLEDSGDIAADGAAGIRTFTLAKPRYLEAGTFWIALETQDAIVVFRRYSAITEFLEVGSETVGGCRYDRGGGYGALTDPCPAVVADIATNFTSRVRVDTIA